MTLRAAAGADLETLVFILVDSALKVAHSQEWLCYWAAKSRRARGLALRYSLPGGRVQARVPTLPAKFFEHAVPLDNSRNPV